MYHPPPAQPTWMAEFWLSDIEIFHINTSTSKPPHYLPRHFTAENFQVDLSAATAAIAFLGEVLRNAVTWLDL